MRYDFQWSPRKAAINLRKHGISFERATVVFRDSDQISVPDIEHSEFEERWITIGLDGKGVLLVLSHTFQHLSETVCSIRLINARKATKAETQQYEEGI